MNKQNKNHLSTQDRINIARKIYNDEIVRKTMHYQKQYGFKLNSRPGHELWNVEGDAFKHAYMGVDMALNLGHLPSLAIGIYHENETPNNPAGEWNMDSWNNNKGREVAKEIQKEYGDKFFKFTKQQQDDIKAEKIMQKMKNGELIISPKDSRKFNGFIEKVFNNSSDLTGKPLGFAMPINTSFIEQILQDLPQNKAPKISESPSKQEIKKFVNPVTGDSKIFTREKLDKMDSEGFSKNEDAIFAQLSIIGIPSQSEVNRAVYNSSSQNADGKWVTIKGHHVLIND